MLLRKVVRDVSGVGMKRTYVVSLLLGVVLLASGSAVAQLSEPISTPKSVLPSTKAKGIPVGPFLFHPGFGFGWEHRDNIFYTPDKVSDQLWRAQARFLFDMPIHESRLSLSYMPVYRNYQDHPLNHKWSHFVDLKGNFIFSNGLKIDAGYRFVSSVLDTREVDPGGELVFNDQLFDKNFANLRIDYWLSPTDGISFQSSYETIRYDKTDQYTFNEYDRTRVGGGWIHQMSATLVGGLIYNHEKYDPKDTYQYRTSSSDEIVFTFDGDITPVWKSGIQVGWRNTSYDQVPGLPKFEDASGLVLRGHLDWILAFHSTVRLDVLRQDFPSNYQFQSHYVATGAGLSWSYSFDRFTAFARFRYQNNDYNQPDVVTGKDRSDDITTFGLGAGYKLSEIFSLTGSYTYQKRDSVGTQSYDINAFLVGLNASF